MRTSEAKCEVDVRELVPRKYHDFLDVFDKKEADKLPPHRPFDHHIPLVEGANPSFGPIYPLSPLEQLELKKYLEENLKKGFIRPSESSVASPILFVKKKDGSLRLCVDYRRLNSMTVKNRYPLPLINDLLDQLRRATIYTKMDLRGAYNLLRIKEGEEWKTAFRTRYGLFEYAVMPFGLTNAPASFQHLMNHVFRDMLDVSVIVYLDDILVFSKNEADHELHVREVFKRLREYGLYAKADKCEFDTRQVEFLGFVVSPEGISMDKAKVQAVQEWPRPQNIKDVQSFLGFANFYRRFIKGFGTVARPLHSLTRKGSTWDWNGECEASFEELKRLVTTGPVLRHWNPSDETVVETDASDFAIGAVLSQRDKDGLRPVAFISRKMTEPELNYPVHDKEFLAIAYALQEWRHYLEGVRVKFEVLSDHRSLEYFLTTKLLNRRQARWGVMLADYDFSITYRPGAQGGKPDALSRRSDHSNQATVGTSVDPALNSHNVRPLLSRTQLLATVLDNTGTATTFDEDIEKACVQDSEYKELVKLVGVKDKFSVGEDGLLRYEHTRYIPKPLRAWVMRDCHDAASAGHPGRMRTLHNVRRLYWWPGVRTSVVDYVTRCQVCQRDKTSRQKPAGLLMPLPTAEKPWSDITVDMVGPLVESEGYNAVLVVVDRLTKMARFIPTTTSMDAPRFAELFFEHVYSRFGLPSRIVSDRGSVFVSQFWKSIAKLVDVDHRYSTAFHPQTDGQTEIVNQWMEQYLRMYVSFDQLSWPRLLCQAELCYNSSRHSTTGVSPLMAYSGVEPRVSTLEPCDDALVPVGASDMAFRRIGKLQRLHDFLRQQIDQAQASYKKYYDRKRRKPDINVGDLVFVRSKHIRSLRPTKKLEHRNYGPFKVIDKINENAYRLELPSTLRIHNVLPVSVLSKCSGGTTSQSELPSREQDSPAQATGNTPEDETYRPVSIHGFAKAMVGKRREDCVLVKWEGFELDAATWEPTRVLSRDPNWEAMVDEYRRRPTTESSAGLGRGRRVKKARDLDA
jgi:hypothetical protein